MTLQEKIEFLEEIMDVEEETLTAETILDEIDEWDSLSTLSLTVEMKKRYNKILTTEIIKNFKTVDDVCQFIPD
ncbi:MAG: acyl carrier protein [Eubacterium sp.]|jgi:Phosphopantetheine attachment site.|nr:acyl carrier protein [Eubacterium sp.]